MPRVAELNRPRGGAEITRDCFGFELLRCPVT